MPKIKSEKQYFSHDYGARNDEKMIALLAEHGPAGYGLFWCLVEKLFEADGFLDANYKLLSYDLRVDESIVKKIIEGSKLFKVKSDKFYSESVLRRLDIRRAKTAKTSASAKARWDKEHAEQAEADFKLFWKAYPKQEGPDAAMAIWLEKKPPIDKCLKALEWQKKLPKWQDREFIPMPASYLKAGRWNDIQQGHEEAECPECGNKGSLKKGHKGAVNCGKCGHKFEVQ